MMSGTSADGIDVAIVDLGAHGLSVAAFGTFAYPPAIRRQILMMPEAGMTVDVCRLNFVIGELFAEALLKLCRQAGISVASIDLIGSHGQTVYHDPAGVRLGGRRVRSTLQIGEGAVIAARTGITTVADFRPADIAAGGHGAPLVAYVDHGLFASRTKCRVVQNIGGIANLTYLPPACSLRDVIAFDTGPGNMVIDRAVCNITSGRCVMDKHGRLAAAGRVDERLLKRLMQHAYFRRRPPKTTGRETFGCAFTDAVCAESRLAGPDLIATLTALTARSIAQACRRFLPEYPEELILCGGGARNPTLVEMLRREAAPAQIRLIDEFGINADAKEAVAFAVLAVETVRGRPANVPAATGAKHPAILGKIIPGRRQ
jgi:anhydro-N-acetylmuramic acid kinase